jgi:hypothetical protein
MVSRPLSTRFVMPESLLGAVDRFRRYQGLCGMTERLARSCSRLEHAEQLQCGRAEDHDVG